MLSKTSFFNPTIFKKNISRFWLLVVAYLAAQLLVLPLVLHTQIGYNYMPVINQNLLLSAVRTIYQTLPVTNVIAFFGACASAMAVFSYLYSARSANMMASLPVRRESMFISCVLSIYAVVIAVNVLAVIIALLVGLAQGLMLFGWLCQWFLAVMAQFTLYFGLSVLCAFLTGSMVAMPAIYFVMNFAAICVGAVCVEMVNMLTYGLQVSIPRFVEWLTPFVWLMNSGYDYVGEYGPRGEQLVENLVPANVPELIGYTLAGLVFLAIAGFLCRRRAMESAGDVVAVPTLRPVFKLLACLAAGLGGGLLFYLAFLSQEKNGEALRLICSVVVLGFVGYVLAEMLVNKTTRINLKRTSVPALLICLVMAAGIWSVDSNMWGVETRVPQLSDVKAVTFGCSGGEVKFTEDTDIAQVLELHLIALSNKDRNEDDYLNYDTNLRFTYYLEDGSSIYRRYQIRYDENDGQTQESAMAAAILNTPRNILLRKETRIPITEENIREMNIANVVNEYTGETFHMEFTPQEAYELYSQCIYPDMLDGTIGLVNVGNSGQEHEFYRNEISIWLYSDKDPYDDEFAGTRSAYTIAAPEVYNGAYIGVSDERQVWEEHFYTYPTPESHRTNAWLQAHGIKLSAETYLYK